jgi:hypothetical protein
VPRGDPLTDLAREHVDALAGVSALVARQRGDGPLQPLDRSSLADEARAHGGERLEVAGGSEILAGAGDERFGAGDQLLRFVSGHLDAPLCRPQG